MRGRGARGGEGGAGGTDLRRRVQIVPGAVHRGRRPLRPDPGVPRLLPWAARTSLSGVSRAPGPGGPLHSRGPRPARLQPPPGPAAPARLLVDSARRRPEPGSAREGAGRAAWGAGETERGSAGGGRKQGAGTRGAEREARAAWARGRSLAERAGAESPRRRQMRRGRRGCDSASRPAPTRARPAPSERELPAGPAPLMVGTNLGRRGGGRGEGGRRGPPGIGIITSVTQPPSGGGSCCRLRSRGCARGPNAPGPRLAGVKARRSAACTPIPPRLHPGCSWRPAWQPFSKDDCFRAGQLGGGSLGPRAKLGSREDADPSLASGVPGWAMAGGGGWYLPDTGVPVWGGDGGPQAPAYRAAPPVRYCCLVEGRGKCRPQPTSHSALVVPRSRQGARLGWRGRWKGITERQGWSKAGQRAIQEFTRDLGQRSLCMFLVYVSRVGWGMCDQ